jgi:Putative sensor
MKAPTSIPDYLNQLRAALKGADPALIQDALWDAESHLNGELSLLRWKEPTLSEAQMIAKIFDAYGSPEEIAEAYCDRDALVAEALQPKARALPGSEAEPEENHRWPGFWEILWTPYAYGSLLYLLLSFCTGVLYFTWVVTGFSLCFGLSFVFIGLLLALPYLMSLRFLAYADGRLIEGLVGTRMPRRVAPLPERKGWWNHFKGLLGESYTWKSFFYLLLHMPMGIFSFVLLTVCLSVALSFILAPLTHWIAGMPIEFQGVSLKGLHLMWSLDDPSAPIYMPSNMALALMLSAGVLFLVASLHLALALGRFMGWLARQVLLGR